MKHSSILYGAAILLACVAGRADATDGRTFESELLSIQQAWAHVNYEIPAGDARAEAFDALEKRAETFARQNPKRAEALIWEAIIESSYAGAKGGLGALGLAKEARGNLEAAMKIDAAALDGSAYTSLGTLYYKVPGFPIGFGDADKARKLLTRALELNPNGIDPNYFYGDFMLEEGKPTEAVRFLEKAQAAAPRPNRALADKGRQQEVATKLQLARSKL